MLDSTEKIIGVAKSMHIETSTLEPDTISKVAPVIDSVLRFVEAIDLLIETIDPSNTEILKKTLEDAFVDMNLAAVLALLSKTKASGIILRVSIETSLYVMYFFDHLIESKLWANGNKDMSFKATVEYVCSKEYLLAASGMQPNDEVLQECKKVLLMNYRRLSELVHSKFRHLSATNTQGAHLDLFVESAVQSFDALTLLVWLRAGNTVNFSKHPSIERLAVQWRKKNRI